MSDLKFEMRGRRNEQVDLYDFSAFVWQLNDCIARIHKSQTQSRSRPRLYVTNLKVGSAVGCIYSQHTCVELCSTVVSQIRSRSPLATRLSGADIRAFKKLADPLDHHTEAILLDDSILIDRDFVAGCDWILSSSVHCFGELVGRLDGLNIHNHKYFRIYPEGIERGAECFYDSQLHSKVVSCLGKRAKVMGTIHRDPDGIGIDCVTDVVDLDPIPEDHELPSLSSLIGLFKDSPIEIGAGWKE